MKRNRMPIQLNKLFSEKINRHIVKLTDCARPIKRFVAQECYWSSGNGRRLVFKRLWVRISAPDTGLTFFTIVVKIVLFV